MSLLDIALISVGAVVIVVLTTYFFVQVRKTRTSQHATASGGSSVKQAGRDLLDIERYHATSTHVSEAANPFLAEGEELATAKDLDEFYSQIEDQWTSAREYISAASLYGKPFMPPEPSLAQILRRGVKLRMILVDPDSKAAREIAIDKCRFSRTVNQSEVLAQVLGYGNFEVESILNRIREDTTGTVAMLSKIKREYPDVEVSVRYIDYLPSWKGTIVDGKTAVYVIYDVPRADAPFRFTAESHLIRYYERNRFDVMWQQGKEVPL